MATKFLDDTGLTHLWGKIKAYVLQNGIYYGTCSTAKGTAAKTATVDGVTELKKGITIAVKFTNENTSTSPTLKVNTLEAKAIKKYGTTAVGTSAASSWQAGAVVTMTYDGTNWVAHDWNNTTYSAMTAAEMQTGTATSSRVITPARLKAAVEYHAPVKSVNGNTGTVTLTAADVSAVPTSRTVNNKALSSDITLTASDVGALPDSTTIPTITDTYDGTSSNGMSGKAVKSAIDALDGTISGSAGAGKTLTAFSQMDGKVSATFGSISITKSQVSDFPSLATVATSGSYSDLTDKPVLFGDTSNRTPTEVQVALAAGYGVHITHNDAIYGLIGASNFNSSAAASVIVANVVFYHSLVGLLCFELIGNLNDDTWTDNVYVLAQTSDIPTVPTNVSSFVNDAGYITGYTETDPIFTASAASGISSTDITNWDAKLDKTGILNLFYPVGSYYETSDTTFNPNTSWGGTWVLETEGQVHISGSASGTYQVSGATTDTSDGGSATVTLTTDEIPAHTHGSKKLEGSATAYSDCGLISGAAATRGIFSKQATPSLANYRLKWEAHSSGSAELNVDASHEHDSVGLDQAHNNMQPYIIVNRWHRTA